MLAKSTYEDAGGDIIIASAGGGEGDASGEVADVVSLIEVSGYGGFKTESFRDEVGREAAVAKAAGGYAAGEIAAVRKEVAAGDGWDGIVVAGVYGGVAEDDQCGHRRRHFPSSAK